MQPIAATLRDQQLQRLLKHFGLPIEFPADRAPSGAGARGAGTWGTGGASTEPLVPGALRRGPKTKPPGPDLPALLKAGHPRKRDPPLQINAHSQIDPRVEAFEGVNISYPD